ncbi:MAG TPA: peptidyl-prolyl cis-trans isomerase, partial [Bacteroidota bacterium]|nr:peptidyl-prolyl cis-trans isomerase [Bacteroidota bacterium]
MQRNSVVLLCLLAVFAGCGRKDSGQRPVARLDDQTLTLDDVRARLDSTRGVTEAQVGEFARRWINDELLYKEALRRGLDNKDSFRASVEEAKRQLAINALLQDEVYTDKTADSSPEEISQYYAAHLREFVLPTDVALVSFLLFADRDAANSFRTSVLKGASWSQVVKQTLEDPKLASAVLAKVDSTYFNQNTLLPVELWRVAVASGKPEPSFPVHTDEGSYILIVWKLGRQGQTADQAYVENEIRTRLTIERRRQALVGLIERLRSKHAVELMVNDQADTSSSNSAR